MIAKSIIANSSRAGLAGLAVGGALGLLEAAFAASARPGRGPDIDVIIIGALANGAALAAVMLVVGAFVGLGLRLARRAPAATTLTRAYAAAAALGFPLAAAVLWLARRDPNAIVVLATLGIALVVGAALAVAVYRLRRPSWLRGRARTGAAIAAPALLLVLAAVGLLIGSQAASRPFVSARHSATVSPTAVGQPINVLIITVDTLRWDRIGACGDPITRTPQIDALAGAGVLSCQVITPQPNTNSAHASLFTGTYPNTHRVREHMVDRLVSGLPTLTEALKAQGYTTVGIHSWISLDPPFSGLDRGFDSYQGYVVNLPSSLSHPTAQYFAATFRRLREYLQIVKTTEVITGSGRAVEEEIDGRADVTTDAVLHWLDERDDRPFFLWVHYFDPHWPYTPPPPYDTMYDPSYDGSLDGSMKYVWGIRDGHVQISPDSRENQHLIALYRGEITFTDEQIGRLLKALEERGLTERTLVILTGDHGDNFGEHGQWFHPRSLYDSEIRVPLVMRLPGRLPAVRLSAPASILDITPTVLEVVGAPAPATLEGESLLPVIDGRTSGVERIVFTQFNGDRLVAAVGANWKLIADPLGGAHELYHLASDPEELVNLATLVTSGDASDHSSAAAVSAAREAWSRLADALTVWLERQRIELSEPLHRPQADSHAHSGPAGLALSD
ncbi:MAG: sulfatase [Chloroflexi bacterium]|nr:sulfatase [Chloroflexota bacterium]